jgi:hypothetical protein
MKIKIKFNQKQCIYGVLLSAMIDDMTTKLLLLLLATELLVVATVIYVALH